MNSNKLGEAVLGFRASGLSIKEREDVLWVWMCGLQCARDLYSRCLPLLAE